MKFTQKWLHSQSTKKSLLCIGLDPYENRPSLPDLNHSTVSKLDWCLHYLDHVAPFAAGVKINRNFIKDLSRKETQKICQHIHDYGMIAIDDSKLCDVGSSNEAGFYQAVEEGFDAVTYCPFPGNIEEATAQAHTLNIGIIVLVLMSNPQFQITRSATIDHEPIYIHYAKKVAACGADAVVIGALSTANALGESEIEALGTLLKDQSILIPGLGHQGGDVGPLLHLFGERTIINVGRAIMDAPDKAKFAKNYQGYLHELLKDHHSIPTRAQG